MIQMISTAISGSAGAVVRGMTRGNLLAGALLAILWRSAVVYPRLINLPVLSWFTVIASAPICTLIVRRSRPNLNTEIEIPLDSRVWAAILTGFFFRGLFLFLFNFRH
jgi:hypothetical protein